MGSKLVQTQCLTIGVKIVMTTCAIAQAKPNDNYSLQVERLSIW